MPKEIRAGIMDPSSNLIVPKNIQEVFVGVKGTGGAVEKKQVKEGWVGVKENGIIVPKQFYSLSTSPKTTFENASWEEIHNWCVDDAEGRTPLKDRVHLGDTRDLILQDPRLRDDVDINLVEVNEIEPDDPDGGMILRRRVQVIGINRDAKGSITFRFLPYPTEEQVPNITLYGGIKPENSGDPEYNGFYLSLPNPGHPDLSVVYSCNYPDDLSISGEVRQLCMKLYEIFPEDLKPHIMKLVKSSYIPREEDFGDLRITRSEEKVWCLSRHEMGFTGRDVDDEGFETKTLETTYLQDEKGEYTIPIEDPYFFYTTHKKYFESGEVQRDEGYRTDHGNLLVNYWLRGVYPWHNRGQSQHQFIREHGLISELQKYETEHPRICSVQPAFTIN